jgi:hypothetical protein
MVTTDIVDAQSPNARDVLSVLSNLGIRYYRWGGFKYVDDAPIEQQLEGFRQRSAKLSALNAEYDTCAMYHTHSGVDLVGAPVWDIYEVLKGLDANRVSLNYDIGHATVEGGLGGWIDSFRVAQAYIRGATASRTGMRHGCRSVRAWCGSRNSFPCWRKADSMAHCSFISNIRWAAPMQESESYRLTETKYSRP